MFEKEIENAMPIEKVEEKEEKETTEIKNGDAFDETTGQFLGELEFNDWTTEIAIFRDGFFYIYKLDRRYKVES